MGTESGESVALEVRLYRRLSALKLTLATAESCTGGLIGHLITNVPGVSAWYAGGAIAYSNALKTELLGVEESLLAAHGAVSEPVARQMAEGARARLGADVAVAVTGIAGPGGGTSEKPVGLVYFSVSGAGGTVSAREIFKGDRDEIKAKSAEKALNMVLEYLE